MPILAKSEVTYWGSSGPGTSRSIVFEDVTLDETFNIRRNERKYRYPVEVPVTLSDEANSVWTSYLSAFHELEAAKLRFEEAKKLFQESEGGKEIQSILIPETGPLSVEAVVPKEDLEELKALIEAQGASVTGVSCKIKGYNIPNITFTLDEPFLMSKLDKITYKNYSWSNDGFTFNKDGTIQKAYFTNRDGFLYPPYRSEDWKEIEAAMKR